MNRRQKKKKYGLSQKEKDERLKREALKHFPEIYGALIKIIERACGGLSAEIKQAQADMMRLCERRDDDKEK